METSTWTEDMAFDLELATLDGLRYFVTLAVNCHLLSVMNIYLHKFKYRKVKVKVKRRIAVCKRSLRSPLRELTHHMGSHSVTYHPAAAFTPAEAGTRFSDPGGMQGGVDLGGWLEIVYP